MDVITESKNTKEVDTVKLISSDKHEFILDYKCAMVSNTLRSMLSGSFSEGVSKEVDFKEITAPILEKVVQYFYYKTKYSDSAAENPEFPIAPEIALELLMAANFLDT